MERRDASLGAFLSLLAAQSRPSAIARAIAQGPLRSIGADLVMLHGAREQRLELRAQAGLTAPQRRLCALLPLPSATAQAATYRSAQEHLVDGSALTAEFPLMHPLGLPARGEYLFLPLLAAARPVGVLSIHAPQSIERSWEFRDATTVVTSALTLWLLAQYPEDEFPPPSEARLQLTPRQLRVLAAIREGHANAAIATDLGFSVGTIKADITAMSALFGAVGRNDLVRKAERAGF
ncbi:MAG: helix-turn-helix transcriptional regulator [Candidatus Nanopelagicales bacterium]